MMRIITGTAKGVRLDTLEGERTRPTGEKAKEAIFSVLQLDIQDRRVLDLFAGSGQLALEALSRGAASAMMIDSAPEAMDIVKSNAKKTRLFDRCKFLISDYRNYIRKARGGATYSLVFIDPPYADNCSREAVERLLAAGLLARDCILVLESDTVSPFTEGDELLLKFDVIKSQKYGRNFITILRLKEGEI